MDYKINKSQGQPMMHAFLFDPCVYMRALISLKGDIKVEEIEEAAKKAYTQNETTMSKVILENGNAYFQNIPQTGCKVFIDSRSWQEIMQESERDPFKIQEGELFRTYIIPEEKGCKLLMMVHHIAADGKAMLMVLEDMIKNLAGIEVEYKPLNNIGTDAFPANVKPSLLFKSIIESLNRQWKKSGKVFDWEDYFKVHENFWATRSSEVRFETIEKEELEGIKEKCKENKITVNSYMLTKILEEHPEYRTFAFPISLRKDNLSICNRALMMRPNFRYNRKKSFLDNAQKIHKIVRRYMEDEHKKYEVSARVRMLDPILLDSCLMYAYGGYQNKASKMMAETIGYVGRNKTNVTVTNLTNLQFKRNYGRFQVEEVFTIAPVMSATKEVICISTFHGKMTIAYSSIRKK